MSNGNRFVCRGEALVLAAFAISIGISSFAVQPVWDDAWLRLMHDNGSSIQAGMLDRPLVGAIWGFLANRDALWISGYFLNGAAWLCTGLLAMQWWFFFFPHQRRLSLAVGCLTMSPILCQTQMLVINTMLASQIPVLLVYGACLIALRALTRASGAEKWLLVIIALGLVLLGSLLSEYATSTGLACAVLLGFMVRKRGASMKSTLLVSSSFLAWVIVAYLIYWATSNAAFRPEVRPEHVVLTSHGMPKLLAATVKNICNDLWTLSVGRVLQTLGDVQINGAAGVIAVAIGLFTSALVAAASRKRHQENNSLTEAEPRVWTHAVCLVLAVAAGDLPVVLMGKAGCSLTDMGTRVWLPVLPIASCLSVFVLSALLRQRFVVLLVPMLGFLSGYSLAEEATHRYAVCREIKTWGAEVRKHLSPEGLNVAVFIADRPMGTVSDLVDYAFTEKLAAAWPKLDRDRFWAFASIADINDVSGNLVGNGSGPIRIARTIRGVTRSGLISKVIIVRAHDNGSVEVYPDSRDQK
jgi:hypothetical protein